MRKMGEENKGKWVITKRKEERMRSVRTPLPYSSSFSLCNVYGIYLYYLYKQIQRHGKGEKGEGQKGIGNWRKVFAFRSDIVGPRPRPPPLWLPICCFCLCREGEGHPYSSSTFIFRLYTYISALKCISSTTLYIHKQHFLCLQSLWYKLLTHSFFF